MAGASVAYVRGVYTRNLAGSAKAPVVGHVTPAGAGAGTGKNVYYDVWHFQSFWDWRQRNATKTWAGQLKDASGAALVGATVKLIREVDEQVVATAVTDGSGNYSFTRAADDPFTYHAKGWTAATTPQIHGMSDRNRAPV